MIVTSVSLGIWYYLSQTRHQTSGSDVSLVDITMFMSAIAGAAIFVIGVIFSLCSGCQYTPNPPRTETWDEKIDKENREKEQVIKDFIRARELQNYKDRHP